MVISKKNLHEEAPHTFTMARLKEIVLALLLVNIVLRSDALQSPTPAGNSLIQPAASSGTSALSRLGSLKSSLLGPQLGAVPAIGNPAVLNPASHTPVVSSPVGIPAVVTSTGSDPPLVETSPENPQPKNITQPCTCGVFLSGQFKKGSTEQPTGYPALLQEQDKSFPCTPLGARQCQSKCVEILIKHLPNSGTILCATMDRDCHKERAFLFVQNCSEKWINSNLSAGKEYCCKDGVPYQCPLV